MNRGFRLRSLLIFSILFGLSQIGATADPKPKTYFCKVKSVVASDDQGRLGQSEWTKFLSKNLTEFVFSETDGTMRWGGTDVTNQFQVLQYGTSENSMIAAVSVQGAASYVHETLRIRTFQSPWVFRYEETTTITTGICR